VKANGWGSLFYNASKQPVGQSIPPIPQTSLREGPRTGGNVGPSLGVNDPELSPNHAWRHTFKAIGFRSDMSEKVLDAIVGHAPFSRAWLWRANTCG